MGSFRVMQTLGAMAQAVGTAAAICKEKGISPRDLANDKSLVKELQDVLQRDGQFLIGIKEDVGLAASATVSASSYTSPRATKFEKWVDLDKYLMQALPIDGDRFESVELYIKNASDRESVFSIEISESELPGAYNADKLLKKVDIPVTANFEGWVKVEAPIKGIENNRVILSFVKKAALQNPKARWIGWDVALTPNGCEMVEGNYLVNCNFLQTWDKKGKYSWIKSFL
jgi:hypothetical protein